MEYTELDLNNVCRTCKNKSPEMKFLYYRDSESGKEEPRLDEMLMTCTSVQVNNEDGLPKSICPTCLLHLKNAYSFKEQCEKTDLFFRNYLKSLKNKSIKEEIITDFTSNFMDEINSTLNDMGHINDDESAENIKGEPESQLRESSEEDVDYVRIADRNVTIYECRICSKIFYTLEGLRCHKHIHTDNNKEQCLVTEVDGNTHTFSNQSDDGSGRGDLLVDEESVKPEVEVSENNDQEKIDEIGRITNDIYVEEDPYGILLETAKIEEEIYRATDAAEAKKEEEIVVGNGYACEFEASRHLECQPTKQTSPKIKRGRGNPREHPVSFISTGRSRGRPPLLKLNAKSSKNEIGNFPCPQCKEVFTKRSFLEKHAEQHDGLRIHECNSCNKKFSRWDNLKQHKLSHVEVKPYLCMTCAKCFTRRDRLQKHMKLHLRTETHSCDLCQVVFNRAENLAKHNVSMHNIGEKITEDKKYKCQYCQKSFTTEKYRDSHMKGHYGDRKFQCRTCDKTFISKSLLTKHMKFHNDSSKKFLCSECGQRFIRNDYLVYHMRRHRGEKPFKCKFCGKGFPRTTDLTVHERYHTGEKTHLCVICGRGFGRAYNLTVHMRTHTGEKPYRCTYCDAAFAQSNDLKAHVRRHTGERFQCELCPKTFLMGHLLKQHKRVVHGLNIVSNKRRLLPIYKLNPDDPPPVTDSDPLQSQQIEVSELKQEEKSDIK